MQKFKLSLTNPTSSSSQSFSLGLLSISMMFVLVNEIPPSCYIYDGKILVIATKYMYNVMHMKLLNCYVWILTTGLNICSDIPSVSTMLSLVLSRTVVPLALPPSGCLCIPNGVSHVTCKINVWQFEIRNQYNILLYHAVLMHIHTRFIICMAIYAFINWFT